MRLIKYFLSFNLLFLVISCGSVDHKTGFELQKEIMESFPPDSAEKKPIYITSTIPIDSVDVDKLIFDIFRHEINDYPNEVRMIARVYDSSGRFVTNMAKPYIKDTTQNYWTGLNEVTGKKIQHFYDIKNFTVREFGANDSIPYNVALTVDYSGSMMSMMGAIQEATEIFVNMKLPYDNIAIASFNKDYFQKTPMMRDKKDIINIFKMKRNDNAGLFSAVYDAIGKYEEILQATDSTAPRVLVLFTDGDDNYSKTQVRDLIEVAKKNKIFIFIVAFGYSIDYNLKQMAKYTGGKFYKISTKEELISAFRDIYMSLRYYYLVSYKPPLFWGIHAVTLKINVPARTDTLFADDEYDTSDLYDLYNKNGDNDNLGKFFDRAVFFEFDSAIVKPESYYIMDEFADKILSMENLKIEIQGHTDNFGPKDKKIEYNQALSERRAKAVYNELVKRGVSPKSLRWRGFGMSKPIAPNDTEEGRAKNRRTTFLVIAK